LGNKEIPMDEEINDVTEWLEPEDEEEELQVEE